MAENRLKAALFDLDGTLCDTEGQYTILWTRLGAKYRPDIPDFAHRIKGTTLTQIMDRYFPDAEVRRQIVDELNAYEREMRFDFFPGALDFLAHLRSHGVQCLLVTSSNRPKMQQVERQVPDFRQLFDHILTAEDFTASKPAPDCYLQAARVAGCDVTECVVFEDAFTGLQAGTSAGIFTFGMAMTNGADAIRDHCHCVLDGFQGLTYEQVERLRR